MESPQPPETNRVAHRRHLQLALLIVAGIGVASIVGVLGTLWLVRGRHPLNAPAPLFPVGQFSLTSQQAKPFGLPDPLAGQVWIANFVFTRCPTICPALTAKMKRVQEQTEGTEVQLVSISVDPAHDTPEILTAYAAKYGAGPRWHFLTGPEPEIKTLVTNRLKMPLSRGVDPENLFTLAHGSHFVLVGADGQVRGFYDSGEPAAMRRLVEEASALPGGL